MLRVSRKRKSVQLTSKFLVIIVSVHSNTASNIRGTSLCTFSLSLLMIAANRLRASASLNARQSQCS